MRQRCPPPRGAIPLVVKSNDGRPTKIEGNAQHPDSNGGTDRFAQASILNLYDPDRAMRFTQGGQSRSAEAALDFLTALSRTARQSRGRGLSFLVERSNSPTRLRLRRMLEERLPEASWHAYEPVDLDIHRRAASLAFGQPVKPYYRLDKAEVVVALDSDFLGGEPDLPNLIRRFAEHRRLQKPGDSLSRLYIAEGLMSVTGFNADHRLRLPTSAVPHLAQALGAAILQQASPDVSQLSQLAGVEAAWLAKWLAGCAKDLAASRGRSVVLAGHRQPMAVHLLAHALNVSLGNVGQTVLFHSVEEPGEKSLAELAHALNAGQVDTLVVLGGNPVYSAPADLDWAKTQRKAKAVVRLGYYEDETFEMCDWHIPAAHYLESWGDARTSDGTLVPIQPLIAPLFGGLTELEVLARIAGSEATDPYSLVRQTFAATVSGGDIEAAWRKFLHDGFLPNSAAAAVEVKLSRAASSQVTANPGKPGSLGKDNLEVVFYRDYRVDDGRYNNNGWLQELPDPVTKIVWDNVVLVSRKTAGVLGVKNSDVVEVQVGGRSVRGPIWVQPGLADFSVGLALGYGRRGVGRVGRGVGFDVSPLRLVGAENFALGGTIKATGQSYTVTCDADPLVP